MIVRYTTARLVGCQRKPLVRAFARSRLFHTGPSLWQSQRRDDAAASTPAERNIFAEVEEGIGEAEEEAAVRGKTSRLEAHREAMAREPAWDGEERLQDTILRMVMDKYQPLRVKGGVESAATRQHPADTKLATIQMPSPTLGSATFTSTSDAPDSPTIADVSQITVELGVEPDNDGRRLAKTPADAPWRAVYVSPLQPTNGSGPVVPSVYYGKYLGLPTSGSGRSLAKTARGKDRLKLAGIKAESLPLDDRNKMRAIREGVRRWDRAGRMRGVKEEAMQYRRQREEEIERESMTEDELEELLVAQALDEANATGVLREGEEQKLSSSSALSAKPGDTVIAMSGGRGINSVANERIEAAMKTDFFRRNKLRGKPLEKDLHASNPFLKGEERIMNRLIQRQGAAPAWIELNGQVETETHDFRRRLMDSWLRRASRMILATSHLRQGLEPLRNLQEDATFEALQGAGSAETALTAGQQRLVGIVAQYKDAEWEARERAYHDASLKQVCDLIRKYNVIAPVSARRGVLVREWELERMRLDARMNLVRHLSDDLLPAGVTSRASSSNASRARGSAASTAGQLGNAQLGPQSDLGLGRTPRSVFGSDGGASSGDSTYGLDDASISRPPRRRAASTGLGFAELARRTAQRARELVNW